MGLQEITSLYDRTGGEFMKRALFALGQIVATPGALRLLAYSRIDPWKLIDRHVTGDWGDLDDADKQENEFSVKKGFRILSAYGKGDRKLWIITEADRSVTTILRPDEY
jgi:hypothetical protein